MFVWIADNAVTLITAAVVLAAIAVAVITLVRDKKRGSGGCSGNCAACGMCCRNGKKQ